MMMDMGAGVQQQGMQPQPDWCASCSSRCCAHLGAHASTHLIGDAARGSPPHMGADWSSGDCANDEGDWRGPMPQQQLTEGEAPPLPVLWRLNRQDTCLDTEQRLSAAANEEGEERLSRLAAKLDLDAAGYYVDVNGEKKKLSLSKEERGEQARRAAEEAKVWRRLQ